MFHSHHYAAFSHLREGAKLTGNRSGGPEVPSLDSNCGHVCFINRIGTCSPLKVGRNTTFDLLIIRKLGKVVGHLTDKFSVNTSILSPYEFCTAVIDLGRDFISSYRNAAKICSFEIQFDISHRRSPSLETSVSRSYIFFWHYTTLWLFSVDKQLPRQNSFYIYKT